MSNVRKRRTVGLILVSLAIALIAVRVFVNGLPQLFKIASTIASTITLVVSLVTSLPKLVNYFRGGGADRSLKALSQASEDLSVASREGASRRLRELLADEAKPLAADVAFVELHSWGAPMNATDEDTVTPRGSTTDCLDLDDLVRRTGGGLFIWGGAGSGKTVAAITLVLRILKQRNNLKRSKRDPVPVPVFVSVSGWTANQQIRDWFIDRLFTEYPKIKSSISRVNVANLIEHCRIVPVLDGLDELDAGPAQRHASGRASLDFLRALADWPSFEQSAPIVITCRAASDETLERQVHGVFASEVSIRPLAREQIYSYLARRLAGQPVLTDWKALLDKIGTREGVLIPDVLSTPWRLFLAATQSRADQERTTDQQWPSALLVREGEDPSAAEERINESLLAGYVPAVVKLMPWIRERRKPGGRDHRQSERDTRRAEKVERWLTTLAKHLAWQADMAKSANAPKEMNGADIVPHLLWSAVGERKVRVLHVGLILVLILIGLAYLAVQPMGLNGGTIIVSVVTALFAWLFWGYRWQLPHVGVRRKSRFSPISLVLWLWHAIQSTFYGRGVVYNIQVNARLIRQSMRDGGFIQMVWTLIRYENVPAGLDEALEVVERRQDRALWNTGAEMSSPVDTLWAYPKYILSFVALISTFVTVALCSIAIVKTPVIYRVPINASFLSQMALFVAQVWLILGGAIAISGSLWLSRTPWARYMVGVTFAACRRRRMLPLRLGGFLEWACKAGLLRRAGAVYQFRHRDLQEWLARDR